MKTIKTSWRWGDKTRLAHAAQIHTSYLSNIMHGRNACNTKLAIRLEEGCRKLGYQISRFAWVFPDTRDQNLFPKQILEGKE